jgi:hypothetical protein
VAPLIRNLVIFEQAQTWNGAKKNEQLVKSRTERLLAHPNATRRSAIRAPHILGE